MGNSLEVSNFNHLFLNSTSSSVTSCQFSPDTDFHPPLRPTYIVISFPCCAVMIDYLLLTKLRHMLSACIMPSKWVKANFAFTAA